MKKYAHTGKQMVQKRYLASQNREKDEFKNAFGEEVTIDI